MADYKVDRKETPDGVRFELTIGEDTETKKAERRTYKSRRALNMAMDKLGLSTNKQANKII